MFWQTCLWIRVEVGYIYDVAYLVEGGGELIVSTTRPETIFGDEAVAIHPDDERYKVWDMTHQ